MARLYDVVHDLGIGHALIDRAAEAASLVPGLPPGMLDPRAFTEQLLGMMRRRTQHGILL